MHSSRSAPRGSGEARPAGQGPAVADPVARVPTGQGAEVQAAHAAQGPTPAPVQNLTPTPILPQETPEAARGRLTLSTAFVRVGADGHLTVELHDGRVLVLRDVVMGPTHYDGVQVLGGHPGAKYRGAYADVATARPGGVPASEEPVSAAANPIGPERSSPRPR